MGSEHTHPGLSRSKGVSARVALHQRLQQRLGVLISCIKAFGEPMVHWCQKRRALAFTLLLHEAVAARNSKDLAC